MSKSKIILFVLSMNYMKNRRSEFEALNARNFKKVEPWKNIIALAKSDGDEDEAYTKERALRFVRMQLKTCSGGLPNDVWTETDSVQKNQMLVNQLCDTIDRFLEQSRQHFEQLIAD